MATPEVDKELLVFNGIDGRTGQYLIPPMRAKNLVNVILGERELAKRDGSAALVPADALPRSLRDLCALWSALCSSSEIQPIETAYRYCCEP